MLKQLQIKISQGLAITLILAVLSPAAFKLSHVFTHHEHEICDTNDVSKTHFHQLDFDCEFYKFKLSNSYFFIPEQKDSQVNIYKANLEDSYYLYFLPHQQLVSYLRGPPQLA